LNTLLLREAALVAAQIRPDQTELVAVALVVILRGVWRM
jgi:hypothetical protein